MEGLMIQGKVQIAKEGLLDSVAHSVSSVLGSKLNLQLVSLNVIDPETEDGKRSAIHGLKIGPTFPIVSKPAEKVKKDSFLFPINFNVDQDFGTPGAILLNSEVEREFFLESITLQPPDSSTEILFSTKSWINQSTTYPGPRIFFANEAYLPCDTPKGIQKLRKEELVYLRGDGTGERKTGERIYDYAFYDNLGNPDSNADLARPVLGGSRKLPYPRRCRTGGKRTQTDPKSEEPGATYLPRDEAFSTEKSNDITSKGLRAIVHGAQTLLSGNKPFTSIEDLHNLYAGKLDPALSSQYSQEDGDLLKFPPPTVVQANKEAWMTDEEFARQRLAGMNPIMIQRLTSFPPESNLDANVHGLEKCGITEDHLEGQLQGLTVQQALNEKRLYILDYHDSYITPYIAKVNEGDGKAYTSRTLFFLTKAGLLLPVVIELLLPPKLTSAGVEPWTSRVFTCPSPGKINWLWQLAKGHVALVDTAFQHLCAHWMQTHACMEPFVIATRRHLSAMHPISMFLSPHFKDTMNTNVTARGSFLNSGGRIEKCFITGKYSNEVSSIHYTRWRFDEQALPKDLISRGMAEADEGEEHGIRLNIEDYPYAKDGLELWAAIHTWVKEYVGIYYESDKVVEADVEVQAWWKEVREVGHGDHKDAPWWAKMNTIVNLVEAIATLLWMATGLHSVVGFGQYPFAGFMPNSPTMGRRLIPEEGSEEQLLRDPKAFFLASFSTQEEATSAMTLFEITSQHMSGEVYLGGDGDENPSCHPRVVAAYQRFHSCCKSSHPRPHLQLLSTPSGPLPDALHSSASFLSAWSHCSGCSQQHFCLSFSSGVRKHLGLFLI